MKSRTRKILNFLFMAVALAMLIIIAFSNNELVDAWGVLSTLSLPWLLGCIAAMVLYISFDALMLYSFLKSQKEPVTLFYAFYISLQGLYYSAITPGASGGQPMQIYFMRKQNISIGMSTSALAVRFFFTQFMMVVPTVILWLCNQGFVEEQIGGAKYLVIAGLAVNAVAIPLIILLAFNKSLVARICHWLIRLGHKIRIVKHPEKAAQSMDLTLNKFHTSITALMKTPWEIVRQFLLSAFELGSLMAVSYCVYRAFGLCEIPWYRIMMIALMLYVSASYIPLPGGSGMQEGGFLLFYNGLYLAGELGLALLVWRFFTYYLIIILGVIITFFQSVINKHFNRRIHSKKPNPGNIDGDQIGAA